MSRGLARFLAVACCVIIANVYYAQPLLHTIARSLGVSQASAGLVVTATQLGFAAGLVFVVLLGDITQQRPVLTGLLAADAAALAGSALSGDLPVLAGFAVLVGLASVAVQMIIPYAATMARDEERASTIGILVGAILIGILLSRAFAGLIAGAAGWRGVYAVAAAMMVLAALAMGRLLPSSSPEARVGYGAQLRSVAALGLAEPALRWRSLIGAAQFAAFSCFWTTVTLLLSGPPFRYSQAAIGLFALVGAAGAGSALTVGRVLDRRRRLRWPLTGAAIAVLGGSFAALVAGATALGWLIAGALVMDAASQTVHVANQAVIYDLAGSARSRITAVYMVAYFIGGAAGSAAGTVAYSHGGWRAACGAAAGFCIVALIGWLAAVRHEPHPSLARSFQPVSRLASQRAAQASDTGR